MSSAKTGMLYSGATPARAGRFQEENIPGGRPGDGRRVGDALSQNDLAEAIRTTSPATILTPNLPEAEVLLG